MEKLDSIFFYHLEKSIKSYRQYAQSILLEQGHRLTIDQWMVLKVMQENPDVTQNALAELVFKDKASVTRIIKILVDTKHLKRAAHESNRKLNKFVITAIGDKAIKSIFPTIKKNRKKALSGLTISEVKIAKKVFVKIISNCKK
ncbi:MAG: MarR family transcriptional regulator [Bacteroidia bacterium]|nr:MarR family transcriptional regulator [Bacteroidia bacterium]